jgi:hypothetical protein
MTDLMDSAPEDVPDEVMTQAKKAFTRRTKREIAAVAWDSLVDGDAPAWDYRLRFEHPEVQIDLRILGGDGWSSLEGRVRPPVSAGIELESDDGHVVRTGEVTDGVFTLQHVSAGLRRLCFSGTGSLVEVCTDWFRV